MEQAINLLMLFGTLTLIGAAYVGYEVVKALKNNKTDKDNQQ